ncbi:MAG: hypothetical protein JRJ03_18550 [Deltaproteobacteria bacterium]|nr:hypothetical protein [Deltaproteobacteria bacterium]
MEDRPPQIRMTSQPRLTEPYYPYEPEDEINLLDYILVLLKHKWLIIIMVLGAGISAVYVSLRMPNIYRSEATIMARKVEKSGDSAAISLLRGMGGLAGELIGLGGGGSAEKFQILLKSRILTRRVVDKRKIMPRLFSKIWDPQKRTWIENPPPTFQDAYRAIMGMMTISRDRKTDALTIKFDHEDPRFARDMVDYYLTELSEMLREETLTDASENQRFLRMQLMQTSDVLMKEKIYAMLAREIEKETFARAQKYYSFQVLDPPIVPDLDKKVKPKRSMICMLSVIVAFFVAVFLAFFIEYINRLRTRETTEEGTALVPSDTEQDTNE